MSRSKKPFDESLGRLKGLEQRIGYSFSDTALLRTALIHPSYSSEQGLDRSRSNQRLEFLGDAILEGVVSDYLYREHPTVEEGELTRLRASLVFETALAVCAKDIGLGEYLFLGKGEERSGGREKNSILSDAFEALIGAVFLDGGVGPAKQFIYDFVINDIDELSLLIRAGYRNMSSEREEGSCAMRPMPLRGRTMISCSVPSFTSMTGSSQRA